MEQTALPDAEVVTIRHAANDDDVIAIHQFLLIVAKPQMRVPVSGYDSLLEIIRVTRDECAVMAIRDGHLIGTMGLMQVQYWYNPEFYFLTERWNFVLPQFRNADVGRLLETEAEFFAEGLGIEFINQGKIRTKRGKHGRLMLTPRASGGESDSADQRRA